MKGCALKMDNIIDSIAKTLMYKGPTPKEIIFEAISNNYDVNVESIDFQTHVTIKSTTAYDVSIIDTYIYDQDSNLIKQLININGKNKIIFDKYGMALNLIDSMKLEVVAS